jgi:beta-phosphoglucomutase-like phosphatase (HAD superfamily)
VPPARCLAIEDSRVGVVAAKAAGMRCAAFRNGTNGGQDLSAADLEFADFRRLDLSAL